MNAPLFLRLVCASLLFGCFGVAGVKAASDTPKISRGMTSEQIRERWGKPQQIRPFQSPEGQAEVWVYSRLVARQVQPIATQVEHLPTFSPGLPFDLGTEPQLVYELETTWVHQDMHLLLYQGQLVSWKENYRQRRSLTR